jgi:hypothetical protein
MGLVVRLKKSPQTIHGDAIYREKLTNQTNVFGIKQFINSHSECNEAFKEGDLVLFGGKFTLDDQKKLMVNIIFLLLYKIKFIKLFLIFFFFLKSLPLIWRVS